MRILLRTLALPLALALTAACRSAAPGAGSGEPLPAGAEARSLFGEPLVPPAPSPEARALLESRLAEARRAYDNAPTNGDSIIWLGRRTAYLGRYREAIDIFSRGIAVLPADARMYRHRGHRYITVRKFDSAIVDLAKAAALVQGLPDVVEPDGVPNARNTPTSTLQSNVWYHLGLAYYVRGEWDRALSAYRECLKVSRNPDMLVATSHWLYMTLRRMGREQDAAQILTLVTPDMDIIENGAYHRLLLMYKEQLPVDSLLRTGAAADSALDDATVGYGVGNWHLYNGRRDEAIRTFRRVLAGSQWASFGYIAAEADLRRLGVSPR